MAAHDLYGFPITLNELQKAERAACDDLGDQQVQQWQPYIEADRLPQSEARIKELIRKVSVLLAVLARGAWCVGKGPTGLTQCQSFRVVSSPAWHCAGCPSYVPDMGVDEH